MGITKEQYDYILAHINDRPRRDVARKAGVSVDSVYRIARKMGADMLPNNLNFKEGVMRLYPRMTSREVAMELGCSTATVRGWASRLGLQHDPDVLDRIRELSIASLSKSWSGDGMIARRNRFMLTRRMDELRIMGGMPQRTRLKFRKMPRRVYHTIWKMERRGYLRDELDPYVLYWDVDTERTSKEEYISVKHGIKFLPLPSLDVDGDVDGDV